MRVCIIEYKFHETSPRPALFASALAAAGHTVDVLSLRRPGQPRHEVLDGVNIYRIRERVVNERNQLTYLYRVLMFLMFASLYLSIKHLAHPYQLIQVESVPDFLVFSATLPKLLGTPVILDIYDIVPEFYASKFNASQTSFIFRALLLAEHISVAFVDYVIAANHIWCSRLAARNSAENKCATICYSPDPNVFYRRAKMKTDERFTIIYPGTLNFHNGLDIALRALALIVDRIPAVRFQIYGDGPSKPDLQALARTLGISRYVEFHEMVPASQIATIMSKCDIAVIPKRSESGFGDEAVSTKIFDLMAVGIPVIAADTTVERYYFDESLLKFFKSGNEKELATCIFELFRDEQLRKTFTVNALQFITQHNWIHEKAAYLRIVRAVSARKMQSHRSCTTAIKAPTEIAGSRTALPRHPAGTPNAAR